MADLASIGFRSDTRDLDKASAKLKNLAVTGDKTERSLNKSVDSINGSFSTLEKTIGLVGTAIVSMGVAKSTKELLEYSEAWKGINNSLRIVLDSEDEIVKTRERLFSLSKETNSQLSATADLYAELHRSAEDLDVAEESLFKTVRTLNNLFSVGGKDAQTQEGAIRQLSQALGAGALRGDEFNSVIEAAPRVLDALSTKLNISKGQLRDFAATGGITAEILINALSDYSTTAQGLADKTDKLWSQSLGNAETNVIKFVGSNKALADSISSLGSGIESLSEDLDPLIDAAGAMALVISAGLTPAFAKYSISLGVAAKQQLLLGTTAITTRNALGQVTVAAASTTVGVNALGVASKFLLGPWGLLITAVGTAAAVFASSKESSETLRDELSDQETAIKKLEKAYKGMSKQAVGSAYIEAQKVMISLDQKRMDLTSRISKALTSGNIGSASIVAILQRQLSDLDEQAKEPEARLKSIQNIFEQGISSIKWVDPVEEAANKLDKANVKYKKWLESVTGFQTPLEKITSEIERVNKALASGNLNLEGGVIAYLDELNDRLDSLNTKTEDNSYQEWIEDITGSSTIGRLEALQDEIEKVEKAMSMDDLSFEIGREKISELKDEILSLKKTVDKVDVFGGMAGSIGDSLNALRGFTAEGSKEYAKLSVAADAFNAVQAIGAVINQASSGDPYTAFPRMAAMIGAMASLGQSIGSLGGDLADSSAANQAAQGNNVWGDKAASISNSIDITADATDKLVGINTDMLDALKGMQQGIFAASGISARASQGLSFDTSASRVNENPLSGLNGLAAQTSAFTLGIPDSGIFKGVFDSVGKVLGGSKKVTDEGIIVVGGAIEDLINSVSVSAFQEVKSKKYAWSSTKVRTYLTPISEASDQFALVFGSLADSVFAGATSLGFASDDIEQAINEFNVATTRISLKDLSIEAQTEQIEAVFSKIFNDLSVAVIPFLSDFQKTGEELGETLARLSTQVAVAEFAVDALGIELGDKLADPEMFARITDNLSMLAGGVKEFADKTASFTNTFAPESVKLELHTNALTKSLEEVGLALPATADGFFMLMQGLNGTTEEGQKQIATLLNVQETASDYYNLVEDYTDRLSGLSSSLEGAINGIFGVSRATTNLSIDSALAAARLGDFSRALGLDLSKVSANQSEFSTLAEFNIQQAETANKLAELNNLAMGSASVSDMTLTANQEQVSLLTSIDSNIASAYVPQQTQIQNNDNVVVELKALRADIETIKDASESIARSSTSSEDDLDAIRRNGIDVRIEA